MKKSLIVLILLSLIGLVGYWLFEGLIILKILILIFTIISLLLYLLFNHSTFLILTTIFTISYSLYYLFFFILGWPFWILSLVFLVFYGFFFYLFIKMENVPIKSSLAEFYTIFCSFILMEISITFYFWQAAEIRGKAAILAIVFYMLSGIFSAWFKKEEVSQKIIGYLLVGIISLFVVIITTQWYT